MAHVLDYYTNERIYVNGRPWNGFDLPEDDCFGTKPKYFFDEPPYKEKNMFASTYMKTKPIEPQYTMAHTSPDGMQFAVVKRYRHDAKSDYVVAMFEWREHAEQFIRSFGAVEASISYVLEQIIP